MPAQPDAGAPCGRREPTVVELRQFGRDVADSTDSLVSRDSLDSSFQSPMHFLEHTCAVINTVAIENVRYA